MTFSISIIERQDVFSCRGHAQKYGRPQRMTQPFTGKRRTWQHYYIEGDRSSLEWSLWVFFVLCYRLVALRSTASTVSRGPFLILRPIPGIPFHCRHRQVKNIAR